MPEIKSYLRLCHDENVTNDRIDLFGTQIQNTSALNEDLGTNRQLIVNNKKKDGGTIQIRNLSYWFRKCKIERTSLIGACCFLFNERKRFHFIVGGAIHQ